MKSGNMAAIKSPISLGIGLLFILCSVQHSLQACLRPTNLDLNLVIDPDKTSYGGWAQIIISCSPGYEMTGPAASYCYPDSTWNPNPNIATCTGSCQAPPNSNVTGSYSDTSVVIFACIEGFRLDTGGDSVAATCDDGTWNPPFTCELTGCSPPSVPPKATIKDPQSYPYKYNSRVIMKCIGDRTLSGPEFSYCNKTGQWNPDPLTIKCLDQCVTPSFDDPKIIHTSHLSGNSGQSFYDHTDTIRFSCEGGIFVDGPWKAACRDGTWFPHIGGHRPVCKNNCTAPENMSNTGAVFQHSDSHVFECDGTPGMMRMGGPRSVCKHGVWTPRIRCALNKDLRSEP